MAAYRNRPVTMFTLVFILLACPSISFAQFSVTTYHYDNSRTGWNSDELILTPANVNSTTFALLKTAILDEQVDGQPLVVPGVNITAGPKQGMHDVVYLATEGNTIYAIGAVNGNVLLKANFGEFDARH
jgi:hypothetical protein